MIRIVDHVRERYLCPVTKKTETVLIQKTTTRPKMPEKEHGGAFLVTKDLQYCSGLDSCGVMRSHGSGLAFQWEICPFKAIL